MEALVFWAARARDGIEATFGTLAVRRIWEARDNGGPWSVAIEYVYDLRTTPKKLSGLPKVTRPDLDNLTKLVLDAMGEARCFFRDDGQVVSLATLKRHADRDHAESAHICIFVRPLGEDEQRFYALTWAGGRERRG